MNQTIIFYTSALCNLRCSYCYIDKNPILKDIDKKLEESFLDKDYYLNLSKSIFEKDKVVEMQFWGGEPSQGLKRIGLILKDFLDYYPNLTNFMFSTNLTMPSWFEQVGSFFNILKAYNRDFTCSIQLSLDGPEYINDIGRGNGTTKLFLASYNKFIDWIPKNLPNNVNLVFWFKPTLSNETIALLQNKNDIINYFLFFDNLIDKAKKIKNNNIIVNSTVPNTACPSPHTVKDGKLFANYCKQCYEISKENLNQNYFKHYKIITSFTTDSSKNTCDCIDKHCNFCGGGIYAIGLLPEKKISICHSGFTEIAEKYKELSNINNDYHSVVKELFQHMDIFSTCMDLTTFEKYKKMMNYYQNPNSQAAFNHLVLTIRVLAKNQQIDNKYLNESNAIEAANFYLTRVSNCIRDNMNVSGSILIPPVGLIKLLFNGAKEYINASEQIL